MRSLSKSWCKGFAVAALALMVTFLPAEEVFYDGFEGYAANSNIGGQVVGTSTWSVSGLVTGDQAVISSTTPLAGGQCLYLADNGANRPRVTLNLLSAGFISTAIVQGSAAFALREESADGTASDSFTINVGAMTLSRGASSQLTFSVTGGAYVNVPFTTANYTYTPGAWNRVEIAFDDDAKQADLYINGGYAGSLTSAGASYTVSSLTLGTYSSGATGDRLYFDELSVATRTVFLGFEEYADGMNIAGQVVGTGAWTAAVTAPSTVTVSSAFALDGLHSLCVSDTENHFPSARLDLVATGLTPTAAPADQGRLTFYVLEDPTDGGLVDEFEVDATNVAIRHLATQNLLVLNNKTLASGTAYTSSMPFFLSTPNYTYTPGQWNKFTLEFDNIAKSAALYINDGYVATQALRPGETGDFRVGNLLLGTSTVSGGARTGDKIYFDDVELSFGPPPATVPWRSSLYPVTWAPGYADAAGRSLQDFSYAGYHSGAVAVPNITGPIYNVVTGYGADPTGIADSTVAIQNAINAAGTAGGGVVFLPTGTFKVSPQGTSTAALLITKNNVVLRGNGAANTRLFNSTAQMKGKRVIKVSSVTAMDWYNKASSATARTLTADIGIGATVLPVNDASGYAVNDLIVLRNDLTAAFVQDIGNVNSDGTPLAGWGNPGSNYPGRMLCFCRRVKAVSGNNITVDVPIRYPVKMRDNGRVIKVVPVPVQEVGIENLAIGMQEGVGDFSDNSWNVPGTGGYDADGSGALQISGGENCWIKGVNSYLPPGNTTFHLLSNGINLDKSRLITIDHCDLRLAQFKGSNGNGYLFTMAGQEALMQDCHGEEGRHNLSFDMMYCSGNVVLRYYTRLSQQDCDFHQFLSMSNLLDNVTCDQDMLESRLRTEVPNLNPGQTSTESVFWNTKGVNGYIDAPTDGTQGAAIINSNQWGNGYVIGTQGPFPAVKTTDFTEGVGKSSQLVPASLYQDQRLKRLGY